MASTISIPTGTNIKTKNRLATTAEYSQKSNLKFHPGSFLTLATILVFDDIKRAQGIKLTNNLTQAQLDAFDFNNFAGNVLWFMDELVGMESDWDSKAEPDPTPSNPLPTAYGYVQFTEKTVPEAVQRYINHLNNFNARKNARNWLPWAYAIGTVMLTPDWLTTLKVAIDNGTYVHKTNLDALTYDQVIALAFVHIHKGTSKDINFVLLADGDVTAAKEIYTVNWHTNPDAATLLRLNVTDGGFFKVHYVPAKSLVQKVISLSPVFLLATTILEELESSKYGDTIKKIKSFFGY